MLAQYIRYKAASITNFIVFIHPYCCMHIHIENILIEIKLCILPYIVLLKFILYKKTIW